MSDVRMETWLMDKINFRFSLLKARFPDLYQEAENKIAGGVEKKDIVADWLNELICRRNTGASAPETKITNTDNTDNVDNIDHYKNIMAGLSD